MLANRLSGIEKSTTLELSMGVNQLKKEGKEVINFGGGEPDFDIPQNIKEAAITAINSNKSISRYTPITGFPELKSALVEKFKNINNINYDVSEILISCGGKQSLFNAMMALLNKEDEVILPVPYWVTYPEIIKLCESNIVFCQTDKNFKLNASDIEKKISNKTKIIILNTPNNPTGSVVESSEIKKIAKICVDKNIYVISDEVYEYFTYGDKQNKHLSIASLNEDIKNLTITINSISKTYAMAGWRIGYCGANKSVINAMSNIQSHSTSNPSNLAQIAALEAIKGVQTPIKLMVNAFDERRKFMYKRLNEINLSCIEPEGAFYFFADISKTKMNSIEFADRLLNEEFVSVVPGIAFGSDTHVRLSYTMPISEIEKGLNRIEKWLGR